jgi:hypothetical protein
MAWALAKSAGSGSTAFVTPEVNHIGSKQQSFMLQPAAVGRQVFWGMRQSMPSSELLNEHPYR